MKDGDRRKSPRRWSYVSGIIPALITIGTVGFSSGCGPPNLDATVGESLMHPPAGRITAEAYLFDCKVVREGRRNSLRLDVYQTESVLGLAGRGYLGKGVFKGRVTTDSLRAYFPPRQEFVDESLSDILGSSECPLVVGDLDILHLFEGLPDSAELARRLNVAVEYRRKDRPEFLISKAGCAWQIRLTYDRQRHGWRVRRFFFDDGRGLSVRAVRREYKPNATIKASKFFVQVPGYAVRVFAH